MRTRTAVVALILQFVAFAVSATDVQTKPAAVTVEAPSAPPVVQTDAYKDLFPTPGSGGAVTPNPQRMIPQPPAPTYESWDVLRQYPRQTPLPPPAAVGETTDLP